MNFLCLMQSWISKYTFFCAVFIFALFPRPLLSMSMTATDSLAEASRRELVAALLQSAKGEYQGAVDRYQKLLITQPSNAALHYALSKAYVALGVIDSARLHSEKSVQLNPDNKYYAKELAGITHQMNNFREAADRYRQLAALEHGAGKEKLLFTLAQLYQQTGERELAIKSLRELLQGNPKSAPAWLALLELSLQSGNRSAFLEDLALFYNSGQTSLEQKIEFARLFVVRSSRNSSYVDPAQLMVGNIKRQLPANSRLRLSLQVVEGELLFQTGNPQEAVLLLETAVRAKNSNKQKWLYLQANSTLALCYDKLGYDNKSVHLYEAILRIDPNNPLIINNLAYVLAGQGRKLKRAKELALKAVALEPANAGYLDTLGWVLFKMGKYEEAREVLEKAVGLNSGEAEIADHLGSVYDKLGNRSKAQEMKERARKIR